MSDKKEKDDPPFEGGRKVEVRKDKFGNVIKTKNIPRHLARRGMQNASKKMEEAIKPKSKEDEGEYGYEGDMAMSQLRSIIRNSQQMLDALDEKTDLPEWVQSKITLAKDYIETSANYLMSELEESYDGADRRKPENAARRAVVDARYAYQRRRERIVEEDDKAAKAAKTKKILDRVLDKKRKALVNLKPETNSLPMHGNLMTQSPTSDASAPQPGENR